MDTISLHMNVTQGGAHPGAEIHPGAKIQPGANNAHEHGLSNIFILKSSNLRT